MAEDAIIGHDTPILEDVIQCALGDFMAGSYNLSAFLGTKTRTAYGGLSYNDAKNLSRDANGVVYALQYYPTIATVTPAGGSLEGGTMLTITGGGFPIDTADVVVTVGGVRCRVVTSTLETITCVTTDPYPNDDSGVPEPHYVADDNWAAAAAAGKYYIAYDEHAARTFGGDALARASLIVDNDASATRKTARGPWRSVSLPDESSSDYVRARYLVADGCDELSCEPAWISFAPPNLRTLWRVRARRARAAVRRRARELLGARKQRARARARRGARLRALEHLDGDDGCRRGGVAAARQLHAHGGRRVAARGCCDRLARRRRLRGG